MAITAATTIPAASAVPLSAQPASQSMRDRPLSAIISAPIAQAKATRQTMIFFTLISPRPVSFVRGCIPRSGSIFPYSFGTRYKVGSRQNRMPENNRSFKKANPSVANTLSGRPATASKSVTANCTFKISTIVPIKSCAAVPTKAATPTITWFFGFFTSRPAMYTPMVTVMNFSSSPRPPN